MGSSLAVISEAVIATDGYTVELHSPYSYAAERHSQLFTLLNESLQEVRRASNRAAGTFDIETEYPFSSRSLFKAYHPECK